MAGTVVMGTHVPKGSDFLVIGVGTNVLGLGKDDTFGLIAILIGLAFFIFIVSRRGVA